MSPFQRRGGGPPSWNLFIPREWALTPGWHVQYKESSATLSIPEALWLLRISEGKERNEGGIGGRGKGDRAFGCAVP